MPKALKLSLVLLASVSIASCGFNPVNQNGNANKQNYEIIKLSKIEKAAVNENGKVYLVDMGATKGASFTLSINDNLFNTKALPKTIKDIKSYRVALTTNKDAPETQQLNSASFSVDRDGNSLNAPHTITFINVPVGGPYNAVVSAWDTTGAGGSNITQSSNYIIDGSKQVAVSSNTVTVNSDLTITFSNGTGPLNVSLNLQNGDGPSVGTSVTPVNGTVTGTFGAI